MSDTVVVYVTRNGHSRALAIDLGARLGAAVFEIGDLAGRKGLGGWMKAGRLAAEKAATPIRDPGVDLASVKTVVLVQPVWASSVCPPVRSWLLAHAKELSGRRVALFASSYGTGPGPVRVAFDAEFSAGLGSLAACASVPQMSGRASRERILDGFVSELKRR